MGYDASAFERALTPPTLTVERGPLARFFVAIVNVVIAAVNALPLIDLPSMKPTKTYVGRILSHPEWFGHVTRVSPIEEEIERLEGVMERSRESGEKPNAEVVERLMECYGHRGENLRRYLEMIEIPVSALERLPSKAVEEAVEDFLACQNRAVPDRLKLIPTTRGTSSPSGADSPNGSRTTTPNTAT